MTLTTTVTAADAALAGLAAEFDLLLDLTPVDLESAWVAWERRREVPTFTYREPSLQPAAVHDRIAQVDLDAVEDPVLQSLLGDKARELGLQADLLAERNGPRSLERSIELYGGCEDDLFALASELLERLPPADPDRPLVGPDVFVGRARAEVERYREQVPDFAGTVTLRHDVPSLMVVQHELIVGTDAWLPPERIDALVHHEVGTHLLTAETGSRQPLGLLEQGTAGYEETQEALAVLAEYLVGGLDADRLRTLAGRAVAVRHLVAGAGFNDVVEALTAAGSTVRTAWTIAARVFRGGGLTKDVIYLRGLRALVDHLADQPLDPLLVGKLSLDALPAIKALLDAGALVPAAVRPYWLDAPGAADRLGRLRTGQAPISAWFGP